MAGTVKIVHLCRGKGLEKQGHALFQPVLTDNRNPFYIAEVLEVEFDILPHGTGSPALEIMEFDEQADSAEFIDPFFELADDQGVIIRCQFTGDTQLDNIVF